MKRFVILALTVLLVIFGLSGCGCDDGRNIGLVFVNDSEATIITVVADFTSSQEGSQYADNSPLKRGDFFSFEAGEYPVTVLVYDRPVGSVEGNELARIVIREAPPEGERWYVTARGGVHGLLLEANTRWPEGEW